MKKPSIGFVLIECKQEYMKDIVNQLDEIDVVKETLRVEGLWRLVAKLEAPNLDNIRETIQWKIRKMSGIESTLTLVEYMW